MSFVLLPDDIMYEANNYEDARRPVHSDDSGSGSSFSTDYGSPLFETLESNESPSATPPPSPDNKQPFSSSPPASPSLFICLPPTANPCPSDIPILLRTPPVRVGTHLLKSTVKPAPGETVQARTPLDGNVLGFLSTPGTVWVDKLPFVYSLCPLIPTHNKLVLVRRPAGLGQTAFLFAAMLAYDCFTPRVFSDLFGTSPIPLPDPSTPRLETVILNLDMGMAFDYCIDRNSEFAIRQYMNDQLRILLDEVSDLVGLSRCEIDSYVDPDSRKTFQNIIHYLRGWVRLVILVEDINWPLIHSTPEYAFEAAYLLDNYVVRPIRDALDVQFVAGGILLGRPVEDEPTWVHSSYKGDALFTPIACDLTHDTRVRGAFGFSLAEVTELAEELLTDFNVQRSFLEDVKASEPAYRHEGYIEYSMSDVLCRFRRLTGQPGLEEEEMKWFVDASDSDDDEDVDMDEEVDHLLTGR